MFARLEVPVDDALGVGGLERGGNLPGKRDRLRLRQRTPDWRSVEVFHDEIVGTHVVDRADVGMIERRDRANFAREAFGELARPTNLTATSRPMRVSVAR